MMFSMRPQLLSSSYPVTLLILLQLILLPLCPSAQQWTCCTLEKINFTRLTPFLSSPLPLVFTMEQAQEDMLLIQTIINEQNTINLTIWNCSSSTEVCDTSYSTSISSPNVTIASVRLSNSSADDSPMVTITREETITIYWCREELIFPLNHSRILICQTNSTWSDSEEPSAGRAGCNPDLCRNQSAQPPGCNPDMCSNDSPQPPVCVGVSITEGVFIFQNCFEVCTSLDKDSEKADITICITLFMHLVNNIERFIACRGVDDFLLILIRLKPHISNEERVKLFHDLLEMDIDLAVYLTEQAIENMLDTIEDLTSDERSSDFDGKDNFENSTIQELLLDTVEDLSRVLAKNFLLNGSTVNIMNYTRDNFFAEVRELPVNNSNGDTVHVFNEDINGIPETELSIPSLHEKGAVTAVVAVVIVRNLGSYLDIITSSDDDNASSIGTIMTINMFVMNNGSNSTCFTSGSEQKRKMLTNNTRLKRNFRDSPVMLTLSNLDTGVIGCVSWNFSQRGWSPEGIDSELHVGGDEGRVRCSISHFSSFSILVSPTGQGGVERGIALNVVSYIGCGVSIVCLILTILALIMFRNSLNKNLFLVHLNLSISLLVSLVIFVATVDPASSIHALCVVTTSLLHYFLLASFCWMLCEGILLYLMVVRVFGVAIMKWWFLLVGYGFPVPVVAISAGVLEGIYQNYAQYPDHCWLNGKHGRAAAIWTIIVPMMIIIIINSVLLVISLASILKSKKSKVINRTPVWTAVKSLVILLPLMGVTWVIGLLAVGENTAIFAWLFTIFNSLQGFFIFITHVFMNPTIRDEIIKTLKCHTTKGTSACTLSNLKTIDSATGKDRKSPNFELR